MGPPEINSHVRSLSICQKRCGFPFYSESERAYVSLEQAAEHFFTFLLSSVKLAVQLFVFTTMESSFHNLDAAGFLEIWQHFDADGENSSSVLRYISCLQKVSMNAVYRECVQPLNDTN